MMRRLGIVIALFVMTLALSSLLLGRTRVAYDAPGENAPPPPHTEAPKPSASQTQLVDAAVDVEAPPVVADRPLRAALLGWELAAPSAILAANKTDGGISVAMELAPEQSASAVEARLARGGGDEHGADVALMPLPVFVASYERLRALEPKVFAVIAFSHGREELRAAAGAFQTAPPAGEEVKLVAVAPSAPAETPAKGSASATILGLFVLDLAGVPPSRVRLVAPGSADAKAAPFASLLRGADTDRKLALSTADASRFVPIVAVAPSGVLAARAGQVAAWTRAWLDAFSKVGRSAAEVAQRLASKEGLPLGAGAAGAPEAFAILERLGQIEPAKLEEQVTWIGPEAHGAATIDAVLQRTWQLARGGGITTMAAPDPLPTDARVVGLLRGVEHAPAPAGSDAGAADGGVAFGTVPLGSTPLFVYRAIEDQADANAVTTQLGFMAAVFERAVFRVNAKGGEKAARALAEGAVAKYGIAPSRLILSAAEPAGALFATVDVLAPP